MKRSLLLALALLLCACSEVPVDTSGLPVGYGTHLFSVTRPAGTPTPLPADLFEAQAQATRAAGQATGTAGAQLQALAASATALHLSVVGTAGAQMATDQTGAATSAAEWRAAGMAQAQAEATATVGALRSAGTATAVRLELAALQDRRTLEVAYWFSAAMWLALLGIALWLAFWLGTSVSVMGDGLRLKWAGQGQEARARARLHEAQANLLRQPATVLPNPEYAHVKAWERGMLDFVDKAATADGLLSELALKAAGTPEGTSRPYFKVLQDFGAITRGNGGTRWVSPWTRETLEDAVRKGRLTRLWPAEIAPPVG